MIFKQKVTGKSRKLFKLWSDETKQYRITWVREVFGVIVPPHCFAVVRITLPNGVEMWDFVGRRGSYKTFRKAVEACNKHKALWDTALQAKGIRDLEKLFGKLPFGCPVWVKKTIRQDLYELLTQHDTHRASRSAVQAGH